MYLYFTKLSWVPSIKIHSQGGLNNNVRVFRLFFSFNKRRFSSPNSGVPPPFVSLVGVWISVCEIFSLPEKKRFSGVPSFFSHILDLYKLSLLCRLFVEQTFHLGSKLVISKIPNSVTSEPVPVVHIDRRVEVRCGKFTWYYTKGTWSHVGPTLTSISRTKS